MKFFITLSVFLVVIPCIHASEMTDVEMLNECYRRAGRTIARELLKEEYYEIEIMENTGVEETTTNFLLIESISNELKTEEAYLYLKTDSLYYDIPTLYYRTISKNVMIEEKERFFGEPIIEREAKLVLSFRLIDVETGEILIAQEIEETILDEISKKDYLDLKKGIKKKGTSLTRFIEPAVITAIIGGLMYLFYSQKSSQ
jgi:hypothetical protein